MPDIHVAFPIVISLLFAVSDAVAEDPQGQRTAADLLPETVVAYAEIPHLADLIQLASDHPLRQSIQSMPAFEAVLRSAELEPLRKGVTAFEGGMNQNWKQAIASLTANGIHAAFDGATRGVVILIRPSDRDTLERFRNCVLGIAQLGQGKLGIAKQATYRGFTAYAINEQAKMALVDDWFIVTNKGDLGQSIIDRYLDGGNDSFRSSRHFQSAMQSPADVAARLLVDIETLRDAGVAPALYRGRTDNVAAEALAGGLASNLQRTPYALATIDVRDTGIGLEIATPHDDQWNEGREYFFGEDGDSQAPPLIELPGQVFALSSYRDLSQMWLRAPDLMTDKANDQLAKADSTLTTFFSGRDFGEDILGSLEPEIQIVVAQQHFDDSAPQPAIRLPAFALQFQMRNPQETTPEFKRVFQSLVGFLNVVGAMQGQPQLDQEVEKSENLLLISTSYVPPKDESDQQSAAINFNFSPSLAFTGNRMIVASTTHLARSLAAHFPVHSSPEGESDTQRSNTIARLDVDALTQILHHNQEQLVAQNMLEKGHSPKQARAEIAVLFDLLNLFKELSLDLKLEDKQLKLGAELTLTDSSNR